MADSYILLSSMSPKITRNTFRKKANRPTKLALKRNIRRSSIFDNMKGTEENKSLNLADTYLEVSTRSDKSTIEESDIESDKEKESNCGVLSKGKFLEISEWTQQVIAENNKNNIKMSDNPLVSSVTNHFTFDKVKDALEDTEQFLKKFQSKEINAEVRTDSWKEIKPSNDSIVCISSSSDSSGIIEDSDQGNDSQENFLDEVYGNSWRKSKPLVFSEPRSNKKFSVLSVINRTPKSEKKCPKLLYTNIANMLQPRRKLIEEFKKPHNSPLLINLKKLCKSDSSDDDVPFNIPKSKVRLSFNDKHEPSTQNTLSDEFDKLVIKNVNPRIEKPDHKNQVLLVSDDNSFSRVEKEITVKVKRKTKTIRKVKDDTSDDEEVKIQTGKTTKIPTKKPRKNVKKVFTPESSDNEWEKHLPKGKRSFLASLSKSVKSEDCDPSARIFRNNFEMYKTELLQKLFKLYNEKIFNKQIHEDTPLEWNKNMTRTAGFCYNRLIKHSNGSIERKAKIALSVKVLDSADRLRDTLIHELCHAAVWIVNETRDGHGPYFKAWGAKALQVFPELPPIKTCHSYAINSKFTYRCIDCGYSIGRHSKSIDVDRKRCGYCYGKFELLINKKTKNGETKTVPVTPKKPPSAFALFVKENYARYKCPQLNHGQLMKLLGEKFNELKISVRKD